MEEQVLLLPAVLLLLLQKLALTMHTRLLLVTSLCVAAVVNAMVLAPSEGL